MEIEFSEQVPHRGKCRWSPSSDQIAHIDGSSSKTLVIRDLQTLKVSKEIHCEHPISNLVWSPHSEKILLQFQKQGEMWVWSFPDRKWIAEIKMDPKIPRTILWAPRGDAILSACSVGTNLTVWPLDGSNPILLETMKFASKGMRFSHSGKYMAIVYRKDYKDIIQMVSTNDWSIVHEFSTMTEDLEDFIWSADDRFLICWDTPCNFRLSVFSMEGNLVKSVDTEHCAMGIRSISIDPTKKILAVGSYDEFVGFWNCLTWEFMTEVEHPSVIDSDDIQIFVEDSTEYGFHITKEESNYSIADIPFRVHKSSNNKENGKSEIGTKAIKWSPCGSYFVTQLEEIPNVLWIWDRSSWSLISLVANNNPVLSIEWCPDQTQVVLSFCSNTGYVYFWTPETCSIIDVPRRKFAAKVLRWSEDGSACAVIDKDSFFLSYIPQAEE